MNKWARVCGDVQKSKTLKMWTVEIMVYIDGKKRKTLYYERTKRDLLKKINDENWMQRYAESHYIDKEGHLQMVAI
jgi:hypothetical protein